MLFRRSCPLPGTRRPPWHRRLRTAVTIAVTAPVGRYLSRQAAHPRGSIGRLIVWNWLRETAGVNDIAVDLLDPQAGERICEIGCGPGRTLARLAAAGAHVTGVDISAAMVEAATRRTAGRVQVAQGDGTALPAADGTLDAAISVHSIYFWSNPHAVLVEIRRVLRPGGRLVLALRPGDHPLPGRFDPTVYRVPTVAELTAWLRAAGFTDIRTERRPHPAIVVWVIAM